MDSPGQAGIGLLKGIGNLPTDLWNLGMLGSKYTPVGGVIPSVAMRAGWLEDAAVQAYREGNTALANQLAGRASTMMSSGYADDLFELSNDAQTGGSFLSMLIPVGAVVKGAGTAGRVGRAANAADNAADAARAAGAADTAADAARAASAGDTAADAARGANAGDTAADASRVEGPGVRVATSGRASRGPELPSSIQKTFLDGEAVRVVLDEPLTVTRFHGGNAGKVGRYASTDIFNSRVAVREDLALLQEWGNSITRRTTVELPAGTTIWVGRAAPQTGKNRLTLPGGGSQIYIEGVGGKLDPSWFKSTKWFRSYRGNN